MPQLKIPYVTTKTLCSQKKKNFNKILNKILIKSVSSPTIYCLGLNLQDQMERWEEDFSSFWYPFLKFKFIYFSLEDNYNVMLVSAVYHHESAIGIYMSLFSWTSLHLPLHFHFHLCLIFIFLCFSLSPVSFFPSLFFSFSLLAARRQSLSYDSSSWQDLLMLFRSWNWEVQTPTPRSQAQLTWQPPVEWRAALPWLS